MAASGNARRSNAVASAVGARANGRVLLNLGGCADPVPAPLACCKLVRRNAIDRLVRQKDGRLKLNKQDKPVVLVLGTGWAAHSLCKVRQPGMHAG